MARTRSSAARKATPLSKELDDQLPNLIAIATITAICLVALVAPLVWNDPGDSVSKGTVVTTRWVGQQNYTTLEQWELVSTCSGRPGIHQAVVYRIHRDTLVGIVHWVDDEIKLLVPHNLSV